jgi:CubicO group peptidase (beta-lactamase class C family)
MKLTIVIAFLAAAWSGAAAAAPPPPDFRARAEAIVQASFPADGPGGAVVVTRGGQTIYTAGRGLADVGARRPITPATVFRMGSITKQFTAALVLQLVQEGKISLDDPVARFFPDYPQPGASATVRQLLNHTSGIQSYTSIPGWMREDANTNRAYTTAEAIAVFRDLPSPTPPGQAWQYNNSGYTLLAGIVEQVTGRPWHHELEQRIARPLGLRTIGYAVDRETRPDMARGYTSLDGEVRPARILHMSIPHGAGALVGTVGDLARWAQALHHGRVVSPALYTAMTTPAPLPEGRTHPYGFGLGLRELRGRPALEHSGGIFGFQTDSIYIPGEDVFVAVFANSEQPATSPGLVMRRLAALAMGEPFREFTRAQVNPAAVAPFLGVYRVEAGGAPRRFFARDGKYYTARDDAPEREVVPAGGGHFFYPGDVTWFRLVRAPGGAMTMEMHQNGAPAAEIAARTGDIPPEAPPAAVSRAVLESYVGRYQTPGPMVDVALRPDGVLTTQLTGQPAIPLRATSDTEFTVQGVGARVVFHSENGRPNRLIIHQNGRELEGRRVP